jgi:drug/metabolite transporter (DMT)-like permease
MATALALVASLLWGSSDFLGGTAARRLRSVTVVLVSQAAALLGLLVVAAALGAYGAPRGYLGWAVAAGAVGVGALVAFYAALAEGTMGVVAPIAALGVAVPVVVGVVQGDRPSAVQAAGIAVGVVGVVLATGPEPRAARGVEGPGRPTRTRRPVALAVGAAVGFGLVLVFIAHGARTSTVMTLLTMRAVSVLMLLLAALAGRVSVAARRRDLPLLVAVGAGDVCANAAMAVASTRGLLSVVAVLSSLYPVVTALLARVVHEERLRPMQTAGVAGVLAGVVLLAAG